MPSRGGGGFGGGRSGGSRSGGGRSSGGSRSGGRFGGNRSGGRSSFGSSFGGRLRPSSSSYRPPRMPRPPIFHTPPRMYHHYWPPVYHSRPPQGRGAGGCGMLPIVSIVIFVIVVLGIFSMVSDALDFWTPSVDDYGITESTHRRTKLDSKLVTPSMEYITDSCELLYDGVNVRQSMVYFFEKTGVQPYIYITETINGKEKPNSLAIEEFAFETYTE